MSQLEHFHVAVPSYIEPIIKRLIELDWLVHCLQISSDVDLYNPANFLYQNRLNGIEYRIILDVNIYQYMLSAFKKNGKKQEHRDAIALIVFCQITNILIDPTIAIYEKVNYKLDFSEEVLDDLILLRNLDNADNEALALFALGHSNDLPIPDASHIDRGYFRTELGRYRRLKTWDNLYAALLKIIDLHINDKSPAQEKFEKFLDWCHFDFINSAAATSFALGLFFFTLPLMKYKPSSNPDEKKRALFNMGWDLYLIHQFFSKWTRDDDNVETLYASNDKPLKAVLRLAINLQLDPGGSFLKGALPTATISILSKVDQRMRESEGRKVHKEMDDFIGFRASLIANLEQKLLQ